MLPREGGGGLGGQGVPRARKRRGAFVPFSVFLSFVLSLSLYLFTLKRESGGLRPELLVTRDSCVLRSPAALKPDKGYRSFSLLQFAGEGAPPFASIRRIDTVIDDIRVYYIYHSEMQMNVRRVYGKRRSKLKISSKEFLSGGLSLAIFAL